MLADSVAVSDIVGVVDGEAPLEVDRVELADRTDVLDIDTLTELVIDMLFDLEAERDRGDFVGDAVGEGVSERVDDRVDCSWRGCG